MKVNLTDAKPIKPPKSAIFYFAAFLAVFYFFFTTPKTETETGKSKSTRSFFR